MDRYMGGGAGAHVFPQIEIDFRRALIARLINRR